MSERKYQNCFLLSSMFSWFRHHDEVTSQKGSTLICDLVVKYKGRMLLLRLLLSTINNLIMEPPLISFIKKKMHEIGLVGRSIGRSVGWLVGQSLRLGFCWLSSERMMTDCISNNGTLKCCRDCRAEHAHMKQQMNWAFIKRKAIAVPYSIPSNWLNCINLYK